MHEVICVQCGKAFSVDDDCCPKCGATNHLSAEAAEHDPVTQLTRNLLQQARTYQERGDLVNAIRCATDALSMRPNCSTIHTILGSLYEQKGEQTAARRHFQQALTVAPGEADDCFMPMVPEQELAAVRTPPSGWVLPVLIGCIVFSGLAAMLTLWPSHAGSRQSGNLIINILPSTSKAVELPTPKVENTPPTQKPQDAVKPVSDTKILPEDEKKRQQNGNRKPKDNGAVPLSVDPSKETHTTNEQTAVIGPSATKMVPAMPDAPSEAEADQAFFAANYERAAAMYEKILATGNHSGPRNHQRLAQCYQRLGNTGKAREHIELAITGYEAILDKEPENLEAQQELRSCRLILTFLRGE